jgi:hypothetical protein
VAVELTTNKASANPTKTFFVKMITRDILLEDCILDLIDNSVDGAWRSEGSRPMGLTQDTDLSKYTISMKLSPDSFTILDNCGGMTLDDAVNHAFSFGRRVTEEHDEYSIGVYGIGMNGQYSSSAATFESDRPRRTRRIIASLSRCRSMSQPGYQTMRRHGISILSRTSR